ncbi:Ig-like domain-containing protein [Exiguobacterium sp. s140]|uniref:Ig-like domain-containing protein n=1 Tax=Exiguobacterium sp. s140 TaxID=2751290 RepID=UPI001BE51577|nr:Ig-like domain-containing protein [Exiguobacterium sp. s140]
MAKKKQFVTAAAAFAVAASAVAPAITADAASTTVRLSSDYVRGGDLNAALDKEYKGSEIHWYKSSIDMNKLGVFQTAKGFVKGKGIKVEKKLRVLNYAQEIKPESEFVFEQGVPVSGIRVQPVLFADGVVYNKPLFVAGFSTEKVGEFEGTLTYSNKAYGSVTKTVKYKVVASKVEFSEVKHEVKDDMLSVSADVKNLKEGEKVELVIFPGKDESKPLDPYTAEIKDGKVTVSAKDIPAGTHSFILRSGDVKTAAMEFKVEDQTPMVKEVKALNLKQVEVKFNKDLDKASAETVTNYELKIGSDAATNPTAAEVTSEGTVLLTFAAKGQSTDAKLTVKNVKTAKNIVVAETTKEVRFLDVVAPTVGEISIVAPRIIRVNFSEPLASAPTFKLNNGQTAIVSTSWSAGQDYADLTIGIDPENGSSHSLEISGGADYAGFKIDAVTKSFVYQTDATAPKAMISKVVDNNTIEVKLDKEINASTVTGNLEFYHTVKGASGYKATSVQLKNGSTDTLVVDFPVVFPEGQVKFFLGYADDKGTLVQDKWGNKLAATELSAVYAADTVAPTLVSVEGKTKRTIEVKFNEAVTEASAELAGNIVLTDADNKVVAQSAALGEDGKTVTLTATADLAGGNYKVTVKNVVDASNNKIAEVSRTFYVNDMVAPTVNGTADLLAGNKKVKIKFSEAMNAASITDKSKYKLGTADLDSKVTITAVDGNKAVILDFSATNETSLANAEITVGRVADATGNLTADFSNLVTVASAQSTVAATKAEVTGKRSVKLYFDEVITGAVAGDFVVYNDTTPVTVSNLVNSIEAGKSVLTLTVSSDLPFDAEDITVDSVGTTSAKNNDGLLVNFADLEASDKYAPEISTAVFTNGGTADAQDSLVLTFSEALYAPSVQDSDFTVAGRVVEAISVNGAAGTVTLMLKEDGSATSAKPASVSIVNMVEDAARNAKSSQVFTAITPE